MTEIERIVCPVCMHNYIASGKHKGKVADRFNFFDVKKNHFVLVEETKGGKVKGTGKGYRGSASATGFKVLERLTIEDAFNTHRYDKELDALKTQVIEISRELIRIGVMKKSDI